MYGLLIFLLGLGCVVGTIAAIGWWILSPIDCAGKSEKAVFQFSIVDFLCLFIILQIPLLAAHFLASESIIEQERRAFWMVTIVTWIIAPVIWFTCARAISKADVRKPLHRFIFLGLILPFVYYSLVPFLFLMAVIIGWLFAGDDRRVAGQPVWFLVTWCVLVCVYFVCGIFTRWIVRSRERINADAASDSGREPKPLS